MDNQPIDTPEGKMEFSLRILGNELIAFKMTVDDFKMKWMVVGIAGILILFWGASSFGPQLMEIFGGQ